MTAIAVKKSGTVNTGATTIDHDRMCAMEVDSMFRLGCFEEQLITYATCYLDNEEPRYYVSDKAENTYALLQKLLLQGVSPLPIKRYSVSTLVPSGKKEDYLQTEKRNSAQQMHNNDSASVAKILTSLAPVANNSAMPLLLALKEQMHGCFGNLAFQRFSGLLDFAFFAKKIDSVHYLELKQWLNHSQQTTESESIEHNVHERLYSGFAYINAQGNVAYYYNAMKTMTLEKQTELRRKQLLVTPILEKRYCFGKVEMFNDVIADFRQLLRTAFDNAYMNILRYLYQLPSHIDRNNFSQIYNQAVEHQNTLLIDAMHYYGVLWHYWELPQAK